MKSHSIPTEDIPVSAALLVAFVGLIAMLTAVTLWSQQSGQTKSQLDKSQPNALIMGTHDTKATQSPAQEDLKKLESWLEENPGFSIVLLPQ